MSKMAEYTVMGEDGKEYGPVSADEVRQWVAEGRLEKKSPIKPATAKDWVFLGELPEFSSLFASKTGRSAGLTLKKFLILAVLLGAAAGVYFLLQHFK